MKHRQIQIIWGAIFFLLTLNLHGQVRTLTGKSISKIKMDKFLITQMDSLQMTGISIAIINKGKIVYHNAFGTGNIDTKTKIDSSSIFEAASMSKPLFAYFIMKMVDRGQLNLDTPLYQYMPYPDIEKDERYKLITTRLVLTHQTGFPNWRYFDMADPGMQIKYGDLYLKFTPGTQFYYSGEGYLYLAKVIAFLNQKTLQTLDPLFQKEVAKPLGMKYAWFTGNPYISKHKVSGHQNGKPYFYNGTTWPISFPNWDSTYFNPAASLHTEAVSYAHFIIGLMKGDGLSHSTWNEMLKPQIELKKDNVNLTENGDHAWGLGLAIGETPDGRRYEHGGNNGNFQSGFAFFTKQKFAYVFLTNCDKGNVFNKNLRKFLTGQ